LSPKRSSSPNIFSQIRKGSSLRKTVPKKRSRSYSPVDLVGFDRARMNKLLARRKAVASSSGSSGSGWSE